MSLEEISKFIDNKIEQNYKKVVISFFELKVKRNLSDQELLSTTHLIATRLSNMGYNVYRTGQKYIYNKKEYIVESNEIIVAIK